MADPNAAAAEIKFWVEESGRNMGDPEGEAWAQFIADPQKFLKRVKDYDLPPPPVADKSVGGAVAGAPEGMVRNGRSYTPPVEGATTGYGTRAGNAAGAVAPVEEPLGGSGYRTGSTAPAATPAPAPVPGPEPAPVPEEVALEVTAPDPELTPEPGTVGDAIASDFDDTSAAVPGAAATTQSFLGDTISGVKAPESPKVLPGAGLLAPRPLDPIDLAKLASSLGLTGQRPVRSLGGM
jgi:hypothetical protein